MFSTVIYIDLDVTSSAFPFRDQFRTSTNSLICDTPFVYRDDKDDDSWFVHSEDTRQLP